MLKAKFKKLRKKFTPKTLVCIIILKIVTDIIIIKYFLDIF